MLLKILIYVKMLLKILIYVNNVIKNINLC